MDLLTARDYRRARLTPGPLCFGLAAEEVRVQMAGVAAGIETVPEEATGWPRLRAKAMEVRNRWAARFIVKLVPPLERVIPWSLAVCPICDWKGLTFRPLYGPGWIQPTALCPSCDGRHRHRLFALAHAQAPQHDQPRPTVWMAPEPCLRPMFAKSTSSVITADLEMPEVDLHLDAQMMPFATGSIGLLVSNDVLEHVPDDTAAMAEVKRILADGGLAMIHVPILSTETVEYGFANEGEFGHVRSYGPDVVGRFERAGFVVKPFRAIDLSRAQRHRYGLLPWDTVLLAT